MSDITETRMASGAVAKSAGRMSTRRILLVGYYGKGNFGDDVLLKASHAILREKMPDAEISVIVDGDKGGYVPAMLGEVTLLAPGRHGQFDLIVHGGGGVYFDFATYGTKQRFIGRLVEWAGYPVYLGLEKLARIVAGRLRTAAKIRLGFGIGIGTFTPGSPRIRAALPILATYDALWVRDAQSAANLKRFSSVISGTLIAGSDLAFLTHYWLKTPAVRAPAPRPRLGIILREWAEGPSAEMLRTMFAELAREYDLTGFVLDPHADPVLMKDLLTPYATCIWEPETMRIDDFMRVLSQQDVLLTSRAHGAICGACVGVPSAIVVIEPKLEQVAAMLPNASRMVANEPVLWAEAIAQARAITAQAIASDVAANRAASAAALERMHRWLV